MAGIRSHTEVFDRFEREPFRVGPHKAFLMSRDAARLRTILVSGMAPAQVARMLLTPAQSIEAALKLALPSLSSTARVGIMPRASSIIPRVAIA
jgi:hypothetical protein